MGCEGKKKELRRRIKGENQGSCSEVILVRGWEGDLGR